MVGRTDRLDASAKRHEPGVNRMTIRIPRRTLLKGALGTAVVAPLSGFPYIARAAEPLVINRIASGKALEERVVQLLEQVGLSSRYIWRYPHALSGGQLNRVSLGAALLGTPELVVLDEPTVGLDPVLRSELWTLFREIADAGTTMLVSSHVMDEALRCDDLILLRDGALVARTTPQRLLADTGQQDPEAAFVELIRRSGGAGRRSGTGFAGSRRRSGTGSGRGELRPDGLQNVWSSFRRRPESTSSPPAGRRKKRWMPAFAGMTAQAQAAPRRRMAAARPARRASA